MTNISTICPACSRVTALDATYCASCGHRLGEQVPSPASLHVVGRQLEPQGLWMLGASAVAIVGCLLPWVKVTAPFLGTVTASGLDKGADGILAIVIAAAIAAAGWAVANRRSGGRVWGAIASLLLAGLSLYDIVNVRDAIADATEGAGGLVTASVGVGLYLLAAASVIALIAAVRSGASQDHSRASLGFSG